MPRLGRVAAWVPNYCWGAVCVSTCFRERCCRGAEVLLCYKSVEVLEGCSGALDVTWSFMRTGALYRGARYSKVTGAL